MHLLNNKGKTLVEMMVVIIILGVISSIAYPMLFMNQKITTQQIKESAKRNDIRSIESFLKDDLRNCKNVVESGPPETYEYKINLNSTEEILYKRLQDDQGRYYISRQRGTEVIDFKDIVDIDLEKEQGNNNLYNAQITSTDDKGNPYLHELKIARWEWEVKKKGGPGGFYEFLKTENLFVFGSYFNMSGSSVSGVNATIFITGDVNSGSFNGGSELNISNFFVGGNFSIAGGQLAGIDWEKEEVEIGNLVINKNLNMDSGKSIFGNLYVHENLYQTNGNINSEIIMVKKDAVFDGTNVTTKKMIVNGTLKHTNNEFISEEVLVKGNFIKSGGNFSTEKLHVYGNFNHNNNNMTVSDELYIKGNATIDANLIANKIYIEGTLTQTNGTITANEIVILGDATFLNANVSGDIIIHGEFTLGNGTVNADRLIVKETGTVTGGKIESEVYMFEDLYFSGGELNKIIYVGRDFIWGNNGSISDNVYVERNVNVNTWGQPSKNVFYKNNVVFLHQYYSAKNKFIKNIFLNPIGTSLTITPRNFSEELTKISEPEFLVIPKITMPKPRDAEWYRSAGYIENGALSDGVKIFTDNVGTYNLGVAGANYENVVVVSLKGDINIDLANYNDGGSQLSGVFYAPEGKITIKANNLEGLVLAKNGLEYPQGGTTMKFVGLDDYTGPEPDKIFTSENDYPFLNEMY